MILIREKTRLVPLASHGDEAGTYVELPVPRDNETDKAFIATARTRALGGIYLRQVRETADIERASTLLRVAEALNGLPAASLTILAAIETPQAALAITSFGKAIPRLEALVFDAASLAQATGAAAASRTIDAVRLSVPLAATAAGAGAWFRWNSDVTPREHEKSAWLEARNEGYAGFIVDDRETARRIAAFSAG